MLHYIGLFLGWIIVVGFVWESIKFFVRIINQKKIMRLPSDSPLKGNYSKFMGINFKTHQYVPLYLVTIILIHSLLELNHEGFYLLGFLASCLLLFQISLGSYGTLIKKRKKGMWLYIHRATPVILSFIIIFHVITVWGLPAD